jgi:hypothetical protein
VVTPEYKLSRFVEHRHYIAQRVAHEYGATVRDVEHLMSRAISLGKERGHIKSCFSVLRERGDLDSFSFQYIAQTDYARRRVSAYLQEYFPQPSNRRAP